jgi:hypothetical protein
MTDHSAMRLGRKPAHHDPRVPHLSKHMMLVQPKPAVDWTPAVKAWDCLGNDVHGDCTAAAAYHLIQTWLNNNSIDFSPTTEQALALYAATSDYPKEDDGAVESQVLHYWSTVGVPTSFNADVVTFASLVPANLDELRLAIENFGGCYIGVALPLSAQTQSEWDVPAAGLTGVGEPGSWGGHAIPLVAYDETSFTCVTWGRLIKITPAFLRAYCDEAYAVISRNWLADSGISPPGLNWDGLLADLKAIQG